jgi:mannose-6-phosphate isomerase-like protein (cupin superfamily)
MQPIGYTQRAEGDEAMSDSAGAFAPEARYVSVNDIAYELADGCAKTFRKCLLTTDRLAIHQTSIRGRGDAEDYGVRTTDRAAYVLSGSASLKREQPANSDTAIRKGHLIVIPSGAHWAEQLALHSDELLLLEIARASDERGAAKQPAGRVSVVNPDDVASYEPAGHAKTRNRCLFIDEHMEIVEGLIERGGGAERHLHRDNEQMLYVLGDAATPLLIHYPKGTPHGTGGGLPEPLALLVIYSPPLRESQNALA